MFQSYCRYIFGKYINLFFFFFTLNLQFFLQYHTYIVYIYIFFFLHSNSFILISYYEANYLFGKFRRAYFTCYIKSRGGGISSLLFMSISNFWTRGAMMDFVIIPVIYYNNYVFFSFPSHFIRTIHNVYNITQIIYYTYLCRNRWQNIIVSMYAHWNIFVQTVPL